MKQLPLIARVGPQQRLHLAGKGQLKRRKQTGLAGAVLTVDEHHFRIERRMDMSANASKIGDVEASQNGAAQDGSPSTVFAKG
jgi:hypothetical protein